MSAKRRRVDTIDRLILLANEKKVVASVAELQGRRPSMEDSHINSQLNGNKKIRIFGVCDGHGGPVCSQFLKDNLAKHVANTLSDTDLTNPESVKSAVIKAFTRCEDAFEALNHEDSSGSTCCVLLYFDELNVFYIANCGDSRAIVFSDIAIAADCGQMITTDHKPDLPSERTRIEALGGTVYSIAYQKDNSTQYVHRVNGILSVARSFGDQQLRPYITEKPDVFGPYPVSCKLNSAVLLACDGAFECNTCEQLCATISEIVAKNFRQESETKTYLTRSKEKIGLEAKRALAISNGVLKYAYDQGSEDNITAIFIQFL